MKKEMTTRQVLALATIGLVDLMHDWAKIKKSKRAMLQIQPVASK